MAAYLDEAETALAGQEGEAGRSNREAVTSAEALFARLRRNFKRDYNSHGQTKWREEAREDYAFDAGDQLKDEDKDALREAFRPIVIFNRIGVTVDSVAGQEVANRQEVQFIPRTEGDVKANELLTSAAKWFRGQCEAEDEESDSFRDLVVCGMGWTETRIDYDDNPKGSPAIDRIDPLQMVWDSSAKKRNLRDARRLFHIRRNVPLDEAKALCPGDPKRPFADEDYNASWVDQVDQDNGAEPHHVDGKTYDKGEQGEDAEEGTCTMVRAQWWERVPVWLVVDPSDQRGENILTLTQQEWADLQEKAKIAGAPVPRAVKSTRKVYRQAWLGNVLLEIGDAPCKGHFSFQCMTGKRDRNKNTFFGIVRAMKDPARWSNKWMSQTMHIMNTNAKGGIAVERGQFFDNDNEGPSSWARNEQTTWLKPGALAGNNPKMMAKPQSEFPAATFNLMQFAVSALPQVSGVNVETLGMQANADQAAALDRQRKQSVMIILQPLFDGLRRYRKTQGRVLLYLIQNYLSDGRLIKIEGEENAQYVPLIKQADGEYDVIVDESPTSANQKEATWAILQQLLPVIGKMLPPPVWLALLKYSPLPTSAQADIKQAIDQAGQQPDPDQQKRDAEAKADAEKHSATLANNKALIDAKIQGMEREAATKREIAIADAQHKALTEGLNAPATVDPVTGETTTDHGAQSAALFMSILTEMREDRRVMAAALERLSAPKQVIKNEAGEIVGVAPMGA